MGDKQLSEEDRMALLGKTDELNKDDYNDELYQLLREEAFVSPENMGGPERRAITKYTKYALGDCLRALGADPHTSHELYQLMALFGAEMLKKGLGVGHKVSADLLKRTLGRL